MTLGEKLSARFGWAQSPGEDIANSLSHAGGLLAAALGTPLLLEAAWMRGSLAFFIGSAVFAATVLLLYLGSTVYHVWPRTRFKCVLQVIDHSAIFLLIAGTYTPFALGPLQGPWRWGVLVVIWGFALFGVAMKARKGVRHRPRLAIGLYLAMGWLVLFVIRPLAVAVPTETLLWLAAGGVVYTAGVVFFVNDHKRYCHFIWHLFVLGGTCCHYLAVLSYAS
jgi:hemolysin III